MKPKLQQVNKQANKHVNKYTFKGGICSINSNERHDLREAFEMGLIDRDMISELRLGHCSVFGFPGKNGELITTMEAYKLGMITEDSAIRVLSIQVLLSSINN